ncbi:hypothetical protein [Sinorhizobium medicae]|nr:hypothetical protein [Sinorhizobium medicae]UWU12408.1 hypothetical protein N2598_30200 [Sinorhizobium medicae]
MTFPTWRRIDDAGLLSKERLLAGDITVSPGDMGEGWAEPDNADAIEPIP